MKIWFWGLWGWFLNFWNFRKCFWNENGWLWGGLFSNFYSDFDSFCLFGIFLNFVFLGFFGGHFWVFEIFENVFGMRMGDFGGVYLVTFIQMLPPSAFLEYFWVFGVFWGHFWVFEIFENVFGMRMCDFGGVYLVTFFKILPPSAFFWAMSKKRMDGWMDGWMDPWYQWTVELLAELINVMWPIELQKLYIVIKLIVS